MGSEQNGNGFFSRLKNVFSSSANAASEVASINVNEDVTLVEETDNVTEYASAVEETVVESQYNYNGSVTEKEITLRTVEVTAPPVNLPGEKDLDIRFATSFIQAGGKFIFCENLREAVEGIRALKLEHGWSHVFCWENEIKDAFVENNFQKNSIGFTIENSDAAVSLCEMLIANEGTIILNPKQASRRRLPCFPKTHIILTDIAHLIGSEAEGVERFKQLHKGELPSIIKLGNCNNGHFYDKQRLILNAEGTEDIYVFLVDAIIPASLRP